MSSRSTFIGAVEIGTSKITVLVGQHSGRDLSLIGCGECASAGVVKGAVADYKAATESTHHAIELAEKEAGERLDYVYLAQTGGHLEGFSNEAAINVKSADNVIDRADIRTVCELAKGKALPEGRVVVRHLRRPFRVDGRIVPVSPEHLVGQRLEVGYWTVHGQEQRLADHLHVISGFNLSVEGLVLSSLASGSVVTLPEERQNGVLVIDLGAGTSDFVLYRHGGPHTTGVLAVGGDHLSNDLSVALRLTVAQAEKLKLRYGRALVQARDKQEQVWLDGTMAFGDRPFFRHAIEQITAARTRELLEVVKKKLGQAFAPETCAAGVVLTGGTAKLPGIAECAAQVFGVSARLGEVDRRIVANLREPMYHTALGVLNEGIKGEVERESSAPRRTGFLPYLTRLFGSA